jgi:hemerythrin superfamily protein
MKPFSSSPTHFRNHPELYLREKGKRDVTLFEPYASEILPFFKTGSIDDARESSSQILYLFRWYMEQGDFIGADVAKSFLELGYGHAKKNFEDHLHIVLCDIESDLTIAQIFKDAWDKARLDPQFLSLQQSFLESSSEFDSSQRFARIKDSLPSPMDPFTLLKNDHQKVSELFDQIESAEDSDQRMDLFETLKKELLAHAEVEEQYFYPVLEEKQEDVELEEHAIDEHAHVKQQLEEIEQTTDEQQWMSLVRKLKEEIEHHVEEEENEIFPEVRDILDEDALKDLGETLEKEKQRCLKNLQKES